MNGRNRSRLRTILAVSLSGWSVGCNSPGHASSEMGTLEARLFARSRALWPVVGGIAPVSVCWGQAQLQTTYPVASLRPDLEALLPERKRWVREIVEEQWNGRTPLRFTGWNECSVGSADIELTPIDSGVTSSCANGNLGQSCVDALGRDLADGGGGVFLNLFFGEEALYSSRYQQANPGAQYDESDEPNANRAYPYWLPQACLDEFQYAWSTNNSLTRYPVDINAPEVVAEFMAIDESCSKFNALHEFGHIAGFSHEQQRAEVAPGCDAERDPDVQYVGDTPLGPFDAQSIMSYCRTDDSATLTEQDAEQTNLVYLGYVPDAEALGEDAGASTGAGGGNEPGAPASGAVSGSPAIADASGASPGNAADGGGVACSEGATAGAGTSGTGGSDAPRTRSGKPAASPASERRSEGGCGLATTPRRTAYWPAMALGALLAAARSRRQRRDVRTSPLAGWASARRARRRSGGGRENLG